MELEVVEFGMGEDGGGGDNRGGGLVGEPVAVVAEGLRREGVGAMVEHALGVVVGVCRGLDSKVAKHGVGFPAAQELDSVLLDMGAEEGGGSAGPEGATGQIGRVDAC